jgi:antitoxin component YwqK of YwqJK toxin-antitoxin module
MDPGNNKVFKPMNAVTKVVSLINKGLFEQVRYYFGNEEIASELYDKEGVLLRRSGIIPDGLVREYYGNGSVKRTITFEDGSAHGKGIEYYPGGKMFEENTFRQGRLHGPSRMYRHDGMLWIEAVYNDGRLHGVVISYHDNGNIETRAEYIDGNLDGSYARYDRYGSLQEEGTFNHGGKEGYYKSYHESGWPAKIERYIQGKLVYLEEFDEDGKPNCCDKIRIKKWREVIL